jgi:sugar/nucleoside kinase (ribokinase family)
MIGHTVADIINTSDNTVVKPGGIAYSVAGLKSFKTTDDRIFLCTAVDDKHKNVFQPLFDGFSELPIQKINSMPVVELTIPEKGEREESYSIIPENLSIPHTELKKMDGIYINMVSGVDISLEQLIQLRNDFSGLIYFDVHTFSRGVNSNNERIFRKIPEFHKWAEHIDILQSNELEFRTLSHKNSDSEIFEELFNYGIEQIVITKGNKGADVHFKESSRKKIISEPAIKINSINKVGCGDVFGALYFYKYISTTNISTALKFANTAAGLTTSYSSINDYQNLKNDVQLRLGKN